MLAVCFEECRGEVAEDAFERTRVSSATAMRRLLRPCDTRRDRRADMKLDRNEVLEALLAAVGERRGEAPQGGEFFVTYKDVGARLGLKPRYSGLYGPLADIVGLCAGEGLPILPSVVVSERERAKWRRGAVPGPVPGGGFAKAYVSHVALRGAPVSKAYRDALAAALTGDEAQYRLLCGSLQSDVFARLDVGALRLAAGFPTAREGADPGPALSP